MKKLKNPEIIQSLIRLVIGTLTYFYIYAGIDSGYFHTTHETLNFFTSIFFLYSFINLLSILWVPVSTPRRYVAMAFDIGSTTMSSFLTGGINSVYVMVYLWIYIGYGTRYGLRFLSAAVAFTLIGYNILLLTEDAWHLLTLEAISFLLLIIALPAYLYSLQKKLMQSAQQARAASNAKTEFLSNMTHQIRTPIGGIVGMIDLLNKTELSMQQQQYLQTLSQSSQSLQEIIDDIADFSHIENGSIPLNQSYSNPRVLIDSLVHSLAPLGYERQQELNCFIDESFPGNVMIDTQRLRQLLSNLIRYVIEHSTQQGVYIFAHAGHYNTNQLLSVSIEISFQQTPGTDKLSTSQIPDTNEALPLRIAYQLTRLMDGLFEIQQKENDRLQFNLRFNWKPLETAARQHTDFPQNTRALIFDSNPICRDILEKYCLQLGMDAYATSGNDNLLAHIIWSNEKHTPFDIIILGENRMQINCHELVTRIRHEVKCNTPILYATYLHSPDHGETEYLQYIQATIIKPVSLDILKNTLIKLLQQQHTEKGTSTTGQTALNILIAEDNEINASVVYSHLTDLGHNVDIATDGTTALYAMHKHPYQLVLMDIYMPSIDGVEATRQWRRLEKGKAHIPIIALTASATAEEKERCLQAGMDDFLTKPVHEAQLKKILHQYTNT